ncbi:MAG: hypothetical protein HY539_02630 [Deltaproteobacteria bacterium]|nr:hypothetical protein [Deltaproteobacteria bacterium]
MKKYPLVILLVVIEIFILFPLEADSSLLEEVRSESLLGEVQYDEERNEQAKERLISVQPLPNPGQKGTSSRRKTEVHIFSSGKSFEECLNLLKAKGVDLHETDVFSQKARLPTVMKQVEDLKKGNRQIHEMENQLPNPIYIEGYREARGRVDESSFLILSSHTFDSFLNQWVLRSSLTFVVSSEEMDNAPLPESPKGSAPSYKADPHKKAAPKQSTGKMPPSPPVSKKTLKPVAK